MECGNYSIGRGGGSRGRLALRLRSPTAGQGVRRQGRPAPACCTALCCLAVSRCTFVLIVPSGGPASRPATTPSPRRRVCQRVPAGSERACFWLYACLPPSRALSVTRAAQSGWPRSAACHPAPGMPGASAARRGGQPGVGRRWRRNSTPCGCYRQ
jgi:hypothetical protein